jgi:hypothetical protein
MWHIRNIFLFNIIILYFFKKFNQTTFLLFKGNKYLLILSLILMIIGMIYISSGVKNIICIAIPLLIGFSIFASLWHKHIYGLNPNIPKYCNPYILIVYLSAVLLTIFVLATFINQTIHISTGYTLKQSNSIRSKLIDYPKNLHTDPTGCIH